VKHLRTFENYNSMKLYHVAPSSNRNSIQENGISSESPKRYNNISEDKVYAWEYLKMAMWYALTESRDNELEFDIWEVDYQGEALEDESIGLPYAVKIDSVDPSKIQLIDTVTIGDERISEYSDVEEIIEDIEWS
jgi:hypothetical protein